VDTSGAAEVLRGSKVREKGKLLKYKREGMETMGCANRRPAREGKKAK